MGADARSGGEARRTAPVLAAVKTSILGALEQDDRITPAIELRVQRAVDLLQFESNDAAALAKMELLSCLIRRIHTALLGGRVNAYESGLVRLRRTVERL